jgi:hypothetical protein
MWTRLPDFFENAFDPFPDTLYNRILGLVFGRVGGFIRRVRQESIQR